MQENNKSKFEENNIIFQKKYNRTERRKMFGGNHKYKARRSAARVKVIR